MRRAGAARQHAQLLSPTRAAHAPGTAAGVGNQSMLRMLNAERDADRLGSEARRAAPRPILDETSRHLSDEARAFFESRVALDLGSVTFHRDASAHRAATSLDARAFTTGNNIYLANDELAVDSDRGRALIGHEVAHVAQQARGGVPVLQRQARNPNPQAEPLPPGMMTNEALQAELATELAWLTTHNRNSAGFGLHHSRGRALETERAARARAGAVWLNEPPASQILYTLVSDGELVAVVEDTASRHATGTTSGLPVFTGTQLARVLQELGVRTYAAGAIGATVNSPRFAGDYSRYAPIFAERVNPQTMRTAFPGNAAEYFYGANAPNPAGRVDLNTRAWQRPAAPTATNPAPLTNRTTDFPVVDFLEATGDRVSIKMSMLPGQEGRFSYFDSGLADIQGRSGPTETGFTTFDQAVFNLEPPGSLRWPPNSPSLTAAERAAWQAARQRMLQRARLGVNPDDVADYRNDVSRRMQRGRSMAYQGVIDAYLAQSPELYKGTSYSSLAQINAASRADRAAVIALVADRIATTQIIPGGISLTEVAGLARVRANMGMDQVGQGAAMRDDVRARAFPEALEVGRRGYGPAMTRSIVPGAATGGGGAALATVVVSMARDQRLPTGEQVLVNTTGGTVGGAIGAPMETAVQARLAQTATARFLTSGSSAVSVRGGTMLVRGAGGGLVGGPLASVITLGTMGYYDATNPLYDPAVMDYVGGGGRAFVVGGLSTALTMAMVGSVAGPPGFLLGLIIGVGLYLLTDHLIGARTERLIRDVGEPTFGAARYDIVP